MDTALKRGLALAGTVAIHAAVVAFFLARESQHVPVSIPEIAPLMLVIVPEPPPVQPGPTTPESVPRRARIRIAPPPASISLAPAESGMTEPPPEPADWYGQAETAAKHYVASLAAKDRGGPKHKCNSRVEERWEPEPRKVGLAGGLPYLNLGRCVLGLGFFGCSLGHRESGGGHALDHMRDPVDQGPDDPDCAP